MHNYRYKTIVADPPWPMGQPHGNRRGGGGNWAGYEAPTDLPYSTMTLDAIKALPVSEMAEANAHLYIWTVSKFLEETFDVARAWGFRPGQLLTWCKAPMGLGLGNAFTPTTEFVLTARRGNLKNIGKVDSSWWQWKRGPHSRKPDAFLDIVEQVSPGPYLEMFARRQRMGWDAWGNEVYCPPHLPEPTLK